MVTRLALDVKAGICSYSDTVRNNTVGGYQSKFIPEVLNGGEVRMLSRESGVVHVGTVMLKQKRKKNNGLSSIHHLVPFSAFLLSYTYYT